jgi:hypothetical protein
MHAYSKEILKCDGLMEARVVWEYKLGERSEYCTRYISEEYVY